VTRFVLGVNNCFASRRWPEPEEWCRIIREKFGITYVQFSFDVLDPAIDAFSRKRVCQKIHTLTRRYGLIIHSTFTGLSFYSYNQLLHPDLTFRRRALDWCEQAIYMTSELGAKAFGGPLGCLSTRDFQAKERKKYLAESLFDSLIHLAEVARSAGLEFLLWEPTPVPSELCHTIQEAKDFLRKLNDVTAIPILYCLDTGHQCAYDTDGKDRDTYVWLRELGTLSPVIHIQQTDGTRDNHWPFTEMYNRKGLIKPHKVIRALEESGAQEVFLFLEINHPFEMSDAEVLRDWVESVRYWKRSGLVIWEA